MQVALLHASAGHGHQKAAESLYEALKASGIPEKEILLRDALDDTPPWFKKIYTSIYFNSIKYTPGLWGASYDLAECPFFYQNLVKPGRMIVNDSVGKGLAGRMKQSNPQIILSTHFMPPELLGRLKKSGQISSFLISVVTDFVPHVFWINPGTDFYWVMSDEGKEILEKHGIPSSKITVGGIPIAPRFRPQGKKMEMRKREGLAEDCFTILLTSGSFGLGPTVEVLESLASFGGRIQALVVSGRNEDLLRTLQAKQFPFRTKIYGFVSNMDELMEASDLIVAKPGGITTSESLAKQIPMVVMEPIPGQETGNARILKERNVAFFLGKPGDIQTIVKGIFDYPEVLEEKKLAIQQLARPHSSTDLAQFVLGLLRPATLRRDSQ